MVGLTGRDAVGCSECDASVTVVRVANADTLSLNVKLFAGGDAECVAVVVTVADGARNEELPVSDAFVSSVSVVERVAVGSFVWVRNVADRVAAVESVAVGSLVKWESE